MGTKFPEVEPLLVAYLAAAFPGVTVSVKKPDASVTPYPAKIITVRSDGGNDIQRDIVRVERIGVNVWANTYKEASNLAQSVDSVLRECKTGGIKLVESVLSPTTIANDGPQEQKYMTFQLVVKATDS